MQERYRLWLGVTNFWGVRFADFEVGVEACWSFRFFLGVLGASSAFSTSYVHR